MKYKIGQKVEIIRRDIYSLRHCSKPWHGGIESIDGSYIYVRLPFGCGIIELYPNEIREWRRG